LEDQSFVIKANYNAP